MSHHSGRWSFLRRNFWQNWLMTFWSNGPIEKNPEVFLPGTNWRITQRGKNFSRLENNKKTATTTTTTLTTTTTTTTTKTSTTTTARLALEREQDEGLPNLESRFQSGHRLPSFIEISVRFLFSCWRIKLIDIETISTFQSKPAFSSNVSLSAVAQLSIKEKGSGGGASGRAMAFCPCRPVSGVLGGTRLFRFRIAVYQFSLGVGLSLRTCNRMMHTPSLSSL